MSLLFLIVLAALALLVQKAAAARSLDAVDCNHRADKTLLECGESFSIEVTLRNRSRRLIPFLKVEEQQRFSMAGAEEKDGIYRTAFTAWLLPRQSRCCRIAASIDRRGRYVLRDMNLYGGDFLGLNEEKRSFGSFSEVVVVPREAPRQALEGLLGGFLGDVSARRFILEDPVLTLGYREYTGREPMKMISWTQSARGRGLMVKKQDYTLEPSVAVVLNIDSDHEEREELLERCYCLTRSVCAELEKRGVKYSFLTNAYLAGRFGVPESREGLGARHFSGVLEQLGRAVSSPRMSFEALLEKEARRQSSAGRILITPGEETLPARAAGRLRESAGGLVLVLRGTEVESW